MRNNRENEKNEASGKPEYIVTHGCILLVFNKSDRDCLTGKRFNPHAGFYFVVAKLTAVIAVKYFLT
jgi:hypothetical protein